MSGEVELWGAMAGARAREYPGALGIPRYTSFSSVGSCLPSDSMPTLWPWVVALPLDFLQVLWLYPKEPLPGPRAALLRLV